MQVLCIETSENNINPCNFVKKGNIYNKSWGEGKIGKFYRGTDSWIRVEELPQESCHHTTLFIPLSNIEGETYAKRKDVLVEI